MRQIVYTYYIKGECPEWVTIQNVVQKIQNADGIYSKVEDIFFYNFKSYNDCAKNNTYEIIREEVNITVQKTGKYFISKSLSFISLV